MSERNNKANSARDDSSSAVVSEPQSNREIQILREYLRIPSEHPNIDYEPCVEFLRRQADELQLTARVHRVVGKRANPVLVITWPGREPERPAILLNSHMDVVPTYRDAWTHDPFAADIDANGRIFARGAQDMKSVGMQYLGAVRALRREGFQPRRTVHVMFVPDEEIGGFEGMRAFCQTDEFRALNVGFALDEGIASDSDVFPVFYAERSAWFLNVHCPGTTGHGSRLLENTAGEKVASFLESFLRFRRAEAAKLRSNAELTVGDVTTINFTGVRGGVQVNVVPASMSLSFDIRLAVDVHHEDFEEMLRDWCRTAGEDVSIEFIVKTPYVEPTRLDELNAFWLAFQRTTDELQLKTVKRVLAGATDSRNIRQLGIPAIGFSPIYNTPLLMHDNDEFLTVDIYLRGIEIYVRLLRELTEV